MINDKRSVLNGEKKVATLNRKKDKYDLAVVSGKFCKQFRINFLGISMKDMGELYGLSIENLSNFENTEINVLDYIFYYYDLADDYGKKVFEYSFFKEVIATVRGEDIA